MDYLMPELQVFVLSHNRKNYVTQAVNSILKQKFSSFEVIISDNSTDLDTRDVLKATFPTTMIRFRTSGINVFEHYNLVLSEVTSPLFMICHDDDLIKEGALEKMVSEFKDQSIVAVAGNAEIIRDQNLTCELYNKDLQQSLLLKEQAELAQKYIKGYQFICPFPAYMYRKVVAEKVKFGFGQVGKYSDVVFLLDVLKLGHMKWLSSSLMSYRMHGSNDSGTLDSKAFSALIEYMKNIVHIKSKDVEDYKHSILLMNSLKKKDYPALVPSFVFYSGHPVMFLNRMFRKFNFSKKS